MGALRSGAQTVLVQRVPGGAGKALLRHIGNRPLHRAAWAKVRLIEVDTLVALSLSMGVERGFQIRSRKSSQWWKCPNSKKVRFIYMYNIGHLSP